MIRQFACAAAVGCAAPALAAGPSFTNVTSASGLQVYSASFDELTLSGCPALAASLKGGGAVGDFNNDGWQDLFVSPGCTPDALPDQLYINNGDGTFSERAAQWGVATAHYGSGVAVGDYNGDGWLDLYVLDWGPPTGPPLPGRHKLYRNNGNGTFTDVAAQAGVNSTGPVPDGLGAAFGDYDLDGHLDLAVAAWYPNSGGNRLFRNNGDGTFTDVTTAALPIDMTPVRGFSPSFADMDGDRYPELLWVADFWTSKYFINNRNGTFTESTNAAGVGIDSNGMGSAVGDLDGDGLLDWYVTSIEHSSYWQTGTGNMLYHNLGSHIYSEISQQAGAKEGGWGWGTTIVDVDNDGRLDIVATNGWVLYPPYQTDTTRVFRNQGGLTFADVAASSGFLHSGNGRGLANFDYDNDGDQDIVIFGQDVSVQLFRNTLQGPGANWLRLFFDTSAKKNLAPNGFGTRVYATTAGGLTQMRYLDGGCRYQAVSELSVHFGIAAETSIQTLAVHWADGTVTTIADVPANRTLTVRALAADLDGDCFVGQADLGILLADYGCNAGADACPGDVDVDGLTSQSDLGAMLSLYGHSCLED